jgi:hypothetical protein
MKTLLRCADHSDLNPSTCGRGLGLLGASRGGTARAAKLRPEWIAKERQSLSDMYATYPEAVMFIQNISDEEVDMFRERAMRERHQLSGERK